MPAFVHDGLSFHYADAGTGQPFVFQHGLGGDTSQTFGIFPPPAGVRLLTLDCRGHGATQPFGDPQYLRFDVFADDVLQLLDRLGIEQAVVGGISMGAGVALNIALRYPQRVRGLVLSRPAWLDVAMPDNLAPFPLIASLIRQYGPIDGKVHFQETECFHIMAQDAPDAANSLLAQFDHPRAAETVAKLEGLPNDLPNADRQQWSSLQVPTLVLGNRRDPLHPFVYAELLASTIPQSEFAEITSKSIDTARHITEMRLLLTAFLRRLEPAQQ